MIGKWQPQVGYIPYSTVADVIDGCIPGRVHHACGCLIQCESLKTTMFMISKLNPSVVYTDVSSDIPDHDYDVVSDLWEMDGRNVYRGSRDPHYTHANVYWLYDENLQRVGCSEHNLADHGDVRLLWFSEDPFSTLLQESWETHEDIWSRLPEHVFEKFLAEGWTSPAAFLEHCLHGPLRIVTPQMLVSMPKIYACDKCGRRSLHSFMCGKEQDLDFPSKSKIWFVNDEMLLFIPPQSSSVWSRFTYPQAQPRGDGSSHPQEPEPEQARVQEQGQEPETVPPDAPRHPPAGSRESQPVP